MTERARGTTGRLRVALFVQARGRARERVARGRLEAKVCMRAGSLTSARPRTCAPAARNAFVGQAERAPFVRRPAVSARFPRGAFVDRAEGDALFRRGLRGKSPNVAAQTRLQCRLRTFRALAES